MAIVSWTWIMWRHFTLLYPITNWHLPPVLLPRVDATGVDLWLIQTGAPDSTKLFFASRRVGGVNWALDGATCVSVKRGSYDIGPHCLALADNHGRVYIGCTSRTVACRPLNSRQHLKTISSDQLQQPIHCDVPQCRTAECSYSTVAAGGTAARWLSYIAYKLMRTGKLTCSIESQSTEQGRPNSSR